MAKEKETKGTENDVTKEQIIEAQKADEQEAKKPKSTLLVSGAEFWDFDAQPVFIGRYESPLFREKDSDDGKRKAGDLLGYNFVNETGLHVIGNSHAIEKVMKMEHPETGEMLVEINPVLRIEFLGKIELSNGLPYNKFKIELVEE